VPGDTGLIKLKLRDNLAAAQLPFGKQAQDLEACRLRQRLADLSDPLIKRVSHVVVIHPSMHQDVILLPSLDLANKRDNTCTSLPAFREALTPFMP